MQKIPAQRRQMQRKVKILENKYFFAPEEAEGERLDKYLVSDVCAETDESIENISRSYLQKLMKEGHVLVNGKAVKQNYRLKGNDEIILNIPEAKPLSILPEAIPLDILYEDEHLIFINKPKGMVVHPAPGHMEHTLVNALLYHCEGQLSGINGILRPGIVHRIDRDTTGVIVACKTDVAHNFVSEQLKEHSITRKYYAIVKGCFKEHSGTVDAPIGRHPVERKKMAINEKNGRRAVTHYKVIEELKGYSYVECTLETGRTHQIRVHLSSIGHPLLGDTVYGSSKQPFSLEGQTLHAKILGFIHPVTKDYLEVSAPLPDYFNDLLRKLAK